MQQFTIPQFIDVEDKIIGPITTRQFIIMLASCLVIAIFYKIFDFSLFIVSGLFVFSICVLFAFARINGRPFHFFVLNIIQTFKKPNLRVWNNGLSFDKIEEKNEEDDKSLDLVIKNTKKRLVTSSRLTELSLMVDTTGMYKGEGERSEFGVKPYN